MRVDRVAVYNKYKDSNGIRHCAYCGKILPSIKDMQVDHIVSKSQHRFIPRQDKFDVNNINNLNPSCRRCNHYKRSESLETFRTFLLGKLHERLEKLYTVKVGMDYNIVKLQPWDRLFYFERVKG
jgi:5-methylcytosine-specific restriction endonuclease McrA